MRVESIVLKSWNLMSRAMEKPLQGARECRGQVCILEIQIFVSSYSS